MTSSLAEGTETISYVEASRRALEEAMAACRLANAGADGPQPEDVTEAILAAVSSGPGGI